jgi:hypothetical protein
VGGKKEARVEETGKTDKWESRRKEERERRMEEGRKGGREGGWEEGKEGGRGRPVFSWGRS